MDIWTRFEISNNKSKFIDLISYNSKHKTGKETAEGTECFKVKLTKKPFTIKGEEVPNVTFYYFDTESFVPIMTEMTISAEKYLFIFGGLRR